MSVETVVLSGASGFVGGRLLQALVGAGVDVRCLSRDPEQRLKSLPHKAKGVQADLMDPESLVGVFQGARIAYYLVHSLGEDGELQKAEVEAANNFALAAAREGVDRIIYLGALAQAPEGENSPHIESRHAVGQALRMSGIAVTEFRASVVIGNGSMPFEVVRALVERLPVMITPRWVSMSLQPIGVKDVVSYLLAALALEGYENHIYEIGGRDIVTYDELMKSYEKVRKLRRFHFGVPVVTPRLSSHWLRLVTPAHFRTARRIVESAGHDSIVRNARALLDFAVEPLSVEEAIQEAVVEESDHLGLIDQVAAPENARASFEQSRCGNTYTERRRKWVNAKPEACFETISGVGGKQGWYWGDWLWRFRGVIDRMVGGPGLRRTLTSGDRPVPGAIVDFWTVERFVEGHRMTLRADMKLPGSAWLDFQVRQKGLGTEIEQTVVFACRGLFGQLYWKVVQPIHAMVFDGMLSRMAEAAALNAKVHRDEVRVSEGTVTPLVSRCSGREVG